jgi:meso-butanediol dehydrogenase / (S,S)-butanediol dehydrogenase / diacetyl reductase
MDLGLCGKTVIVTGGSRGLGETIVESFAKEGANVVVGDINLQATQQVAERLTKGGVKVIAVRVDVTNKSDAENLSSIAMESFGKIDILVNNAGVIKPFMFLDIGEQEWDRILDINTKGVYLITAAVLPHMLARKYGKIINVSSVAGREGFKGECNYVASKFAVRGMTQSLAKEVAPYNINVNAVCPGIIHTFMWDQLIDFFADLEKIPKGKTFDETFARVCEKFIPMKRAQLPEDIANAVLFLGSDVSHNITGQSIGVDGGMRMD